MLQFHLNRYYHVYNHGNANDNIFRNEGNYFYFLEKYSKYINPIAYTYAYCLMPNHFHFLIQLKEENALMEYFKEKNPTLTEFQTLIDLNSKQFSHFLNGYTQAFNKQEGRHGKLFRQSTKAKEIRHRKYFTSVVHYIHSNPVHHGFVKRIEDWPYSSYKTFLSLKTTRVKRDEVLDWFGSVEDFYSIHQKPIDEKIKLEMEF